MEMKDLTPKKIVEELNRYIIGQEPVSYTHLDVYKRQALCKTGDMVRRRVFTSMPSFHRGISKSIVSSECLKSSSWKRFIRK